MRKKQEKMKDEKREIETRTKSPKDYSTFELTSGRPHVSLSNTVFYSLYLSHPLYSFCTRCTLLFLSLSSLPCTVFSARPLICTQLYFLSALPCRYTRLNPCAWCAIAKRTVSRAQPLSNLRHARIWSRRSSLTARYVVGLNN